MLDQWKLIAAYWCSILFFILLFFLCVSLWKISIAISSNSQNCFAMLNFMLIFSVFFISGSSIYVFHVSSMSLLNMLNFSSTFLNVQDTVIMTVLISLSNWFYICVISGHTLIISLFPSLWIIFSRIFECLVIFVWILDIVVLACWVLDNFVFP